MVRRVLSDQLVGVLHGRARRRELGGVDRAGDHHDRLAIEEHLLGLGVGGFARIGEALLDGDVAVQVTERVGVGNGGGDEGPVVGGLADFLHSDAVAGLGQQLEIADHLFPIEGGFVFANLMAEVALRGGYGREG